MPNHISAEAAAFGENEKMTCLSETKKSTRNKSLINGNHLIYSSVFKLFKHVGKKRFCSIHMDLHVHQLFSRSQPKYRLWAAMARLKSVSVLRRDLISSSTRASVSWTKSATQEGDLKKKLDLSERQRF